jgi:LemA protein
MTASTAWAAIMLAQGKLTEALPCCALLVVPLLVLLGIVIGMYNSLVRGRNHVKESWAGIDTELKRRYDLIPNLVETVKGYASHEREVLERVVESRSRAVASTGSPASQAEDENLLVGALKRLFAVVEAYPELKASQNFLALQKQLAETEDRLQASRRLYNGNVREFNNRCEMFPTNILASMFHFAKAEFFEIESAIEREAPKVGLGGQG